MMRFKTKIALVTIATLALAVLVIGTGFVVRQYVSKNSVVRPSTTAAPVVRAPEDSERSQQEPLDLSAFINAELDRGWIPGLPQESNLAAMPRGRQELGGVVFNVVGPVQLMGTCWRANKWSFPKAAPGIHVDRLCRKFFLLHATRGEFPRTAGTTVARLVVHYDDGMDESLQIRAGEHVLNWVSSPPRAPTDTNTVLGWMGDNRVSAQRNDKVRIWRTAFENPHPDKKVAALDYVSAMSSCGPLLLGVTVE
jgi:hypothetical protein